jgi:hypothetical protein
MGRMSSVLPGLVLGGLVGCAQLAGIDETTGVVAADEVSLQLEKVSIGATVVRSEMDLTGQSAEYLVFDDAEPDGIHHVPAELNTPDTWSAKIPDGTPPIRFFTPDYPEPVAKLWDFPQRNVFGLYGRLEHANPEPAPMGAMLTLSATLPAAYAATETFQLYTLGSWNVRTFTGAEVPAVGALAFGPVAFPFSSMSSITGRPLEKITTADAVMFLRYIGNRLTGVMEATPFDQTGADNIMGTMTAVAASETLDIMVGPPAAVSMRFAPARPAMPALSMAWYLHAAPGYEVANDNGPLLHAASVAMADTGMISATYGNPFVAKGWPTLLTWSTVATRTYTPTVQMLPIDLHAGLYQLAVPTAGMVLDLPAGLPEVITIDGKPLSTDGLSIAKPTKPVKVTFVSSITNNTLYQLQLYEIIPNMGATALVQQIMLSATGIKPEFTLPPDLFVSGHVYNLRAICIQGGYPDVAVGDLRKRDLPTAVGYLDGGVFTVTP